MVRERPTSANIVPGWALIGWRAKRRVHHDLDVAGHRRAEPGAGHRACQQSRGARRAEGQMEGCGAKGAREVFGLAKDRVNRMGGVRAWKEQEREREVWRRGGEGEERSVGDEEGEEA